MAGIKISDLPAVVTPALTDVFPIDQGAVTYKETAQQLLTLFQANGAALTKVDDTNVTMTLGGSPATSLLNAASMTLGWTGQLAVGRGGTGLAAITAHYLPIGNGTSALTLLAPSATSGVPLISQGAAADPAYGTAVVAGGGTGITSGTAYGVVCAGTTSTGPFQVLASLGNAGEQLTSNGPGALPTWQTGTAVTPSALTRVDDTNVTLTLGGTPATSLLQAVSITAGWSGQLSAIRGGTGIATYTLGDTLYCSAANTLAKLAGNTTTAKQYLSQTGDGINSAAPAWSTIDGGDITGAALTKVDDTNVTLTLGGTPSTALLRSTSLTAGWTGQLSPARGGTGVNNGTSTITIGGNFTMTGAFTFNGTLTGNTSITYPTSGTLATTAQLPTPAALTKVDDTNVTLTLGGTPSTALLQAASLTLGWTGQLAVSRGGTSLSSLPSFNQGRLTLSSGVPVTVSDVTAATTIYFTPFEGNLVSCYDGTRWLLFNLTEISIAVPASTSQMYDVFLYINAGSLTLETLAWTNDTTRATGLVYFAGVIVKSGDSTRKYLGSFRTTTVSGQTEDSQSKRYLYNNFNRRRRPMRVVDTTDSWTYSTASFRQANNNAANQLDFIQGTQEDAVEASVQAVAVSSTSTVRAMITAIGLNSTTAKASSAINGFAIGNNVAYSMMSGTFKDFPQLGRQTLVWLEYGGGSDTQTWFGDGGATTYQTGINGTIMA